MGSLTSRIKAFKAAGTDVVDVSADIAAPYDLFDAEAGVPNVAISGPLPGTPFSGQIRCDRNDGFVKQWNAAASIWEPLFPIPGAIQQGAGGAWKSISPTLSNITLGTGTPFNVLDYIRLPGNLIFWRWKLVLGTSGALSGTGGFLLPAEFPFDVSAGIQPGIVEDTVGYGKCGLTNGNTNRHALTASIINVGPPGTVFFIVGDTGTFVNNSGTSPFVWAAGAVILAQGMYRTSAT